MGKILTINNWKSLTTYRSFHITDYIAGDGVNPYYAYRIEGNNPLWTILVYREMKGSEVKVQVWNEFINRLDREGLIPLSQMRTVEAFKEALESDEWLS